MNKNKIIVTTSWDDGHPLDNKLCKILKSYDLPGTIYTPIKNLENEVIVTRDLIQIAKDFEIGGHTFNHKILTDISNEEIDYELLESKKKLENNIGKEIISFCYPRGKYNKNIMDRVKLAGFKCGRTTELFRTNYLDPFEFHTTIQATNRILASKAKQIFETNEKKLASSLIFSGSLLKDWDIIAKKSFDHILENGGIWHLWGHSWEIEKNNDWSKLKNIFEYIKLKSKNNSIEFLTNGEIFKES
tara:strand:+ start:2474 stop:3208 length:735 start_codon:yes stop_codon:yes gene_type:complete